MRVRVKARASRSLATVTPSRRELARAFVALALRADVPTLAASFAFSAVFAVGPLLSLALTALSTLRDDTFRRGVDTIARAIVPSVSAPFLDAIADQLKRASNPLLLAVSLLGLVWTLSSASDAIVSALEIIGRRDPRAWWRRRLRAVFLGLAVAFAQPVGIARPVHFFMVAQAHLQRRRWYIGRLCQQIMPRLRMPLDRRSFAQRQLAGFQQHIVGDRDLADIVQQPRDTQRLNLRVIKLKVPAEIDHQRTNRD